MPLEIDTHDPNIAWLVDHVGKTKIKVTKQADGFWHDENNCVFALVDPKDMADNHNTAGVGWASLPNWKILRSINDPAKVHDYMFSCPYYMATHFQSEADETLEYLETLEGHPEIGELFEFITDELGGKWWDDPSTRNK